MKKLLIFALFLLLSLSVFCNLRFSTNIAGQYPPGLQNDSRFYFHFKLFDSESMLFENSKVDIGLQNKLTPSYDYLGVRINIEPIAFFDITGSVGVFAAFKAFDFPFLEVSAYDDGFDDESLESLEPLDRTGTQAYLCPTLKLAIGSVIFMHSVNINYFNMGASDEYFYDRMSNSIMAQEDINIENESYLLYKFNPSVMAGLQHYYLYVPGSKYISQRISAATILTPEKGFMKDFFSVVIAGAYLRDRYYSMYFALLVGKEFSFAGGQ